MKIHHKCQHFCVRSRKKNKLKNKHFLQKISKYVIQILQVVHDLFDQNRFVSNISGILRRTMRTMQWLRRTLRIAGPSVRIDMWQSTVFFSQLIRRGSVRQQKRRRMNIHGERFTVESIKLPTLPSRRYDLYLWAQRELMSPIRISLR